MSIAPIEIKRLNQSGIKITWNDGTCSSLSSDILRRACPCASCREQRGEVVHDKPLSPSSKKGLLAVIENSLEDELRLDSIWAVGQYALGMQWGDGHATGIYTFEYLRSLAQGTREIELGQ